MDTWYNSTAGQKISTTIKGIAISLIPVIKIIFGVEIVSEDVNRLIDAVLLIISAGMALYGYIRAKKIMGAEIRRLSEELGKLEVGKDYRVKLKQK